MCIERTHRAYRRTRRACRRQTVRDNAVILKQSFVDVEVFWKTRGKPDATSWAQDGRKHLDSLYRSAEAEKWDDVEASAAALGQTCQSCHAVYRERHDDGSYRIKIQ